MPIVAGLGAREGAANKCCKVVGSWYTTNMAGIRVQAVVKPDLARWLKRQSAASDETVSGFVARMLTAVMVDPSVRAAIPATSIRRKVRQ